MDKFRNQEVKTPLKVDVAPLFYKWTDGWMGLDHQVGCGIGANNIKHKKGGSRLSVLHNIFLIHNKTHNKKVVISTTVKSITLF